MMQQYFEVKRGLPRDTLLLFRLGDFFELFFEDAVTASKLLGLTLTKRQDTPMAGLPAHAIDNYVSKLLAAGKKPLEMPLPLRHRPTGRNLPGFAHRARQGLDVSRALRGERIPW